MPGRARLRKQLGLHPSSANIRNVSATARAQAATEIGATELDFWCDRTIFLKNLDHSFWVNNLHQNLGRKISKLVRPKLIVGAAEIDFFV